MPGRSAPSPAAPAAAGREATAAGGAADWHPGGRSRVTDAQIALHPPVLVASRAQQRMRGTLPDYR